MYRIAYMFSNQYDRQLLHIAIRREIDATWLCVSMLFDVECVDDEEGEIADHTGEREDLEDGHPAEGDITWRRECMRVRERECVARMHVTHYQASQHVTCMMSNAMITHHTPIPCASLYAGR